MGDFAPLGILKYGCVKLAFPFETRRVSFDHLACDLRSDRTAFRAEFAFEDYGIAPVDECGAIDVEGRGFEIEEMERVRVATKVAKCDHLEVKVKRAFGSTLDDNVELRHCWTVSSGLLAGGGGGDGLVERRTPRFAARRLAGARDLSLTPNISASTLGCARSLDAR